MLQPTLLSRRSSRRGLLRGVPVLVVAGGLLQVAGCSPIIFQPSTPVPDPEPEPVETPASIPEQPEPTPVFTPAPEPTPTPDVTSPPDPVQQVLRLAGTFFDPAGHDPAMLPVCLSNAMTQSGLVRVGDSLQMEPDWAIAWEPLQDREGWRFRIRANQSGAGADHPLTAHVFAESWLRLLESAEYSPARSLLMDIENAAAFVRGEVSASDVGIVVVDDWTLDVGLVHRRETFPAVVSSPHLRNVSDSVEGVPDDCYWNGRFTVSIFDDVLATLIANDNYWDVDGPELERIEFSAFSSGLALTEFGHGNLEILQVSGNDAVRMSEDPDYQSLITSAMPERVTGLVADPEVPPFDDPLVRRVISQIIDRRRLELIVEGRVIAAARMFPTGMFPLFDEAAAGISTRFSIDEAYEELANAEYPDPAEWPAFGLHVPALDGYLDRIARDVATQIRENLGIQVPIRVHAPDEYLEGLLDRQYSLSWLDWAYPYADPASVYAEFIPGWRTEGYRVPWTLAEYDDLLLAAEAMESPESRANAWAGCEGLLQEHGAVIPLVHPVEYFLVQPWVEGLPLDNRERLITGVNIGFDFSRGVSVGERPD